MLNVVRYRISYHLTLEEQVDDLMYVWKALGTVRTQRILALVMGVMCALLLRMLWADIDGSGVYALIAGSVFGLVMFATVERRLRKTGRKVLKKINRHDGDLEIVVELTDSEVILRRPEDQQIWKWSAVRLLTDDCQVLRLLTSRYSIIPLPKRGFPTPREYDDCSAFLQQRLRLSGRPVE